MKRFNFKRMIALIITVAMLLSGIPYSNYKANADEATTAAAMVTGQEITLPDGKVGTLIGTVEMIPANIRFEEDDTDLILASEQPDNGVKLVLDPANGLVKNQENRGKVRDRIKNFNGGAGVEITDGTLFFLEYEKSDDFDLTKLSLEGTTVEAPWSSGFAFSRKSNENGIAVFAVTPNGEATNLNDVRLKGSAGKFPEGSSITLKNAYFVSDIHEATVPDPVAEIKVGEEWTVGKIKGTVVAVSEANKDYYTKEYGSNFNYSDLQPENGVQFTYTPGGKVRNRIKAASGSAIEAGIEISENMVFVAEYESTEDFSFSKLTVEGTRKEAGNDADFKFILVSEADGVAIFTVTPKTESNTLFDIRLKGDDGVFADGTTLTLKRVYFLVDIEEVTEPVDPTDPTPVEGIAVGAKRTVGSIEGTISGIVKADQTNMIMESDEPDMQPATVQPEEGVKFEKTQDGGKVRNRFFVNERAGADIAEGDKFVIEFDSSANFDLSMLSLYPQYESATTYADNPELTIDGKIQDGVAVYSVPAFYKDKKIYAIRFKNTDTIPRGANVTFKAAYFLTDVKNASTQIDPNENPVGKNYVVGDLSGKISGYVKLDSANISTESGKDLVISAVQPETGFKMEKTAKVKIRNRFYVNEKTGVVVHKGDKLVIDREIIGGLELENIDFQPQVENPEGFENTPFLKYETTIDDKAFFSIPDSLDGQTIYALRGKTEDTESDVFVSPGSAIIIKGIYFLTDIVDNSAPAKPACPYEISTNVQGIAVTYYNDIFSRGVSWRTMNIEAADSVLQIVNKKNVDDISEFWWDTPTVVTIPDNYGVSLVNNTKDAEVYYCHKAHIENLPDKNEYYYRVGCDESGWSKPGIMKI
ncbi:MAG: fibronectin type III domain-containing protein, partial [Lachnospiraceae bacterium]|nr:fibronectin type III domain-containing protein [Lachnospiraceae bacterium]